MDTVSVTLFIQLVQDLEILVPVARYLSGHSDFSVKVLALSADEKNPFHLDVVRSSLEGAGLAYQLTAGSALLDEQSPGQLLKGCQVLLTATETSARPHRFARALTDRAKELGIKAFTFQHGLENLGLTFFDRTFTPETLSFHSDGIFTWCALSRLHPDISESTRARCIPVGCPKRAAPVARRADLGFQVGVFENLHWDRYSDSYRQAFLNDLDSVAKHCPDVQFLVKPHPGGRWLTDRYKGETPERENLHVLRPGSGAGGQAGANEVICSSQAVITTPSTVALDASMAEVPVLVVGYGMELKYYDPLPRAETLTDWVEFIARARTGSERGALVEKGRQSVSRNILCSGDDACAAIATQLRSR